MKRISLLVASYLMFAPMVNANPFTDVPRNHWAYDAVTELTSKGILTGYPDKTFKGDKPVNRYALAMVVSKLLASSELKLDANGNPTGSITKKDLDTLGALTVEFADELALLGVKVENVQQQMTEIQEDVSSLKSDVELMKKDAYNMIGDNVKISGDMMIRHTYAKEEHDWYNTNNTYTQMKLRLVFDAKIDDNISAKVRWRIFNFGDNIKNPGMVFGQQLGGGVQMTNEIDIANLTIKNFLYGGNLEIGRSFRSSGNGLVLHTYVDGIKYSKKAGKVQVGFNMFYDNIDHDGDNVKDDSSRPIWNLSFKTKYNDNDMYLGFYTQNRGNYDNTPNVVAPANPTIREDIKKNIVELGTKGNMNKEGTFAYDLSLVYNQNEEKGVEDQKGWLGYLAFKYDTKKDWAAKVSIAVADDESQAAIAPITYNRRSTGSSESVFEDIAKGNNWFKDGMRNMQDIKIQAEYKPKKSKHYGRIAYDILSKYKDDNYSDNFSTWSRTRHAGFDIGAGVKDGDAGVMTLEYRYQLAKNTRLRLGYTDFNFSGSYESGLSTGNNDDNQGRGLADYRIFWAEIFSKF